MDAFSRIWNQRAHRSQQYKSIHPFSCNWGAHSNSLIIFDYPIHMPHIKYLLLLQKEPHIRSSQATYSSITKIYIITDYLLLTWQLVSSTISIRTSLIDHIVRSNTFNTTLLNILPTPRLEQVSNPLLEVLQEVVTFTLLVAVLKSTFRTIQHEGLLPHLVILLWGVNYAGIEKFIDFLLSFEGGGHALHTVQAFCCSGKRLKAAKKKKFRGEEEWGSRNPCNARELWDRFRVISQVHYPRFTSQHPQSVKW